MVKANILNDFFVKKPTTLQHEDDIPHSSLNLTVSVIILYFQFPKWATLFKTLTKNKATGPGEVHNRLLIAAGGIINEALTKLFKGSLKNRFPAIWKVAHRTPLHKKGPTELCNNYRPIFLLSCVGKLLERCIHKHVYNFLQYNNIITQSQEGFLSGDSTVNQLLRTYNDLCTSFDTGITTQAIYLDLSKAFDRVWHKGLISKLKAIGITGKLSNWFRDYLLCRMQPTVVKG